MNIVLCGMPGSGKTTVGGVLSSTSSYVLVDTDEEIVRSHGEINGIFAEFGEPYFRDLESAVCERLGALDGQIISTGGGCLLRPQNAAYLKANGKIVYLRTQPETLIARVQGDTTRPLLAGDAKAHIYELYAKRKAIYEAAADIVVDTDRLTPEQVAEEILKKI
ncbi:MAG: shikimate kinase [Clostridia bacterium]|nr:shikimate kinase [Clostridia bacterium]